MPTSTVHNAHQLHAANVQRSAHAAAANAAAVAAALAKLGDSTPSRNAAAGRLRLAYPTASLSELAALSNPPTTKDTIAALLRRLLLMAGQPGDTEK